MTRPTNIGERWSGIVEQVRECGENGGRRAATWLLDGNSTEEQARFLLQGIEDGDPLVLDSLPTFSFGEWAGEDERSVLDGCLPWDVDYDDLTDDEQDECANAFLDGYGTGTVYGAEHEARTFLGLDEED